METCPSLYTGAELERREVAPSPTVGWDIVEEELWMPSPDPPSQGQVVGSGVAEATRPWGQEGASGPAPQRVPGSGI